ncbi:hypothetical protein XANCAGTX0491_001458 [Xanthoria calcicola]
MQGGIGTPRVSESLIQQYPSPLILAFHIFGCRLPVYWAKNAAHLSAFANGSGLRKFSHPLASSIKKTWKWTLSTALGQTPSPQSRSLSHTIPSSQWKFASSIADFLIDADPDPRIRNKARLKPTDLTDPKNKGLRDALQKAEYAMMGDYPDVDIA